MSENSPFVSVIMPVRNEIVYIERSLGAVLQQTYPLAQMEIFVVDGMSDDGTRAYIEQQQQQYPNLYLLDNPERIVPFALNRALRVAKGEFIVRVDGHCVIANDYVAQCVARLQESGADCVGGPIETIGETHHAEAIARAMSSSFGMGGSAFRTIKDREKWVETVAFPAFKRETIEQVGLFDEELVRNQDDEYSYRLRKMGGKILLTPAIQSQYYSRGKLSKLWKQFYQYGYWKVRVLQKHPKQMRLPQFVPLALVVSLLIGLLFPPLFAFVILLYLSAVAYASVKQGRAYVAVSLLAYPAMHLAYGLGFLVGLVRFIGRWDDKVGGVPAW